MKIYKGNVTNSVDEALYLKEYAPKGWKIMEEESPAPEIETDEKKIIELGAMEKSKRLYIFDDNAIKGR